MRYSWVILNALTLAHSVVSSESTETLSTAVESIATDIPTSTLSEIFTIQTEAPLNEGSDAAQMEQDPQEGPLELSDLQTTDQEDLDEQLAANELDEDDDDLDEQEAANVLPTASKLDAELQEQAVASFETWLAANENRLAQNLERSEEVAGLIKSLEELTPKVREEVVENMDKQHKSMLNQLFEMELEWKREFLAIQESDLSDTEKKDRLYILFKRFGAAQEEEFVDDFYARYIMMASKYRNQGHEADAQYINNIIPLIYNGAALPSLERVERATEKATHRGTDIISESVHGKQIISQGPVGDLMDDQDFANMNMFTAVPQNPATPETLDAPTDLGNNQDSVPPNEFSPEQIRENKRDDPTPNESNDAVPEENLTRPRVPVEQEPTDMSNQRVPSGHPPQQVPSGNSPQQVPSGHSPQQVPSGNPPQEPHYEVPSTAGNPYVSDASYQRPYPPVQDVSYGVPSQPLVDEDCEEDDEEEVDCEEDEEEKENKKDKEADEKEKDESASSESDSTPDSEPKDDENQPENLDSNNASSALTPFKWLAILLLLCFN